ncbi:MAG: rhodanese-like domain-containing protein [Methylophilaceae bacterium]
MKSYSDIEAPELLGLLNKDKVLLVDVRNDDEVLRGVIAGAIHIQLAMLPLLYEKLTKASTVIFYCHSGIRSAHAADFAVAKGIRGVHNLVGGIVAWDKAGYSLTTKK